MLGAFGGSRRGESRVAFPGLSTVVSRASPYKMRGVKPVEVLAALAIAAASCSHAEAGAPIALETHVVLTIGAMILDSDRSRPAGSPSELELGPERPEAIDIVVPWGRNGGRLAVHVTASLASLAPDGEALVRLGASVVRPARPAVEASREIRLSDDGSGLFEVYGEGDRRLLLTVQSERVRRAVARRLPEVGAPVRFGVAISRVDGERVVPLETNDLHTFVGQAVEYSFRSGEGSGLESVRLSLTPASISGDVVTIDAEIDGTLPGPDGAVLLSHQERIIASRQSTSTLGATAGNPPAGYRFQVTPDF